MSSPFNSIVTGVTLTIRVGVTGAGEIGRPEMSVTGDYVQLATQVNETTQTILVEQLKEVTMRAIATAQQEFCFANARYLALSAPPLNTPFPSRPSSPRQQIHSMVFDSSRFTINDSATAHGDHLINSEIDEPNQGAILTEPANHHERQLTNISLDTCPSLLMNSQTHENGTTWHEHTNRGASPTVVQDVGQSHISQSSIIQPPNSVAVAPSNVTTPSTQPHALPSNQSTLSGSSSPNPSTLPLNHMRLTAEQFAHLDCVPLMDTMQPLRATKKDKNSTEKVYQCELCKFDTPNLDEAKRHFVGTLKAHHFNNNVICPYCLVGDDPNRPGPPKLVCFQVKQSYIRHVNDEHILGPQTKCYFAPKCTKTGQYSTMKSHIMKCEFNKPKRTTLEPRALREVKRSTKRKATYTSMNEESSVTSGATRSSSPTSSEEEEVDEEEDGTSEESKAPHQRKRHKKATSPNPPPQPLLHNPLPVDSVLVPMASPPSQPQWLNQSTTSSSVTSTTALVSLRSSVIDAPMKIIRGCQSHWFYPTRDLIPEASRHSYTPCIVCHTWSQYHQSLSCICTILNLLAIPDQPTPYHQ